MRDMIVTCWPAHYFQTPRRPWVEIYHYGYKLDEAESERWWQDVFKRYPIWR